MRKTLLFLFFAAIGLPLVLAQGFPWERPLKIATSVDGQTFAPATIFQDSSGVPSVIRWKGDTLACVFQWFRQPQGSPSWDRVAVKFSYDAGLTWTQPTPIVVNGLPGNYQRPFDPTIVVTAVGDSIRIFFSSSDGMPMMGLDSTINTYSAIGVDGVNYVFEPNPRYDNLHKKVIDPAAIIFNGAWHYTAPSGAPQDGAFHCTASDGLNFSYVGQIASDMQHNWTGNLMLESPTEMRFYGSGSSIWYNVTTDGTFWSGYHNTNVQGGDPSALKMGAGNYIMVFVGAPYVTGIEPSVSPTLTVFPNPAADILHLRGPLNAPSSAQLFNLSGLLLRTVDFQVDGEMELGDIPSGFYIVQLKTAEETQFFKVRRE